MNNSKLDFKVFNQYTAAMGLQAVVNDPHNVEFKKMSILSNAMLMRYLTAPVSEKFEVLQMLRDNFSQAIECLQSNLDLVLAEIQELEPQQAPLSNTET